MKTLQHYLFALNIALSVDATFLTMHSIPLGKRKDMDATVLVYRELAQGH